MAFSLSGSTITQSGTDADLSGLSGVAGVTLTSVAGRILYNVGNRALRVTGTLSHDNREEEIIFGTGAPTPTVNVTGTYNIGKVVSYGGKESYTVGSPFTFTKTGGLSFKDYDSNLMCRASGTMNLYGCSIRLSGNRSIWYEIGAHGVIRETHVYSKVIGDTARVYLLSANTDVNGFYCYDLNSVNFNSAMVQFKNYIPYNIRLPFFYNGANNAGKTLYVENFERYGNFSGDQQGQGACKYIYQNKVEGADTLLVYCRGRPNDNDFVVELRKDILINTIDNTGAVLPDVKFYSRDVNNGHRIDFWAGTPATDTVYIPDRTYAFTTDAGGIGVSQDYLSAVSVANNIGSAYNYLATPQKPMIVDDRGTSGVAKFSGIKYGKLITVVSVEMKGANESVVTWTLFDDSSITVDKTTADAYTTVDTAPEVYDRAFSFLEDNYLGETKPIVARSGSTLEAGTYNVVIDKTASGAFAFDGSTVTIKADMFNGGITTTGTVTLLHGANIRDGVYDCDVHINTGANSNITFDGIVVTGTVHNDDTSHTLDIGVGAGTSIIAANPGTGNGQVNVVAAPKEFTITGLIAGSIVDIYDNEIVDNGNNNTLLANTLSSGSTFTYAHGGTTNEVRIQVIKSGYVEIISDYTLTDGDQTITIKQIIDTN